MPESVVTRVSNPVFARRSGPARAMRFVSVPSVAPIVGVAWHGPQTLFDPVANVRLGVAYLRQLTDRYNGSVRTALVAYNWGPGRIDQFVRAGEALPREYSTLVLAAYDRS